MTTNGKAIAMTVAGLLLAVAPLAHADDKAKDKDAKVDSEEGYIEHKLAAETLQLLGKISNTMSPEFSAASKVLKELIEHHVEEEERNIWSDLREGFSDKQRDQMNKKFEAAKKRVRVAH